MGTLPLMGVGAPGGGFSYLLRDDFTTAAGPPLATPHTCEPGPGTLTVTDTNGIISTAGGLLVVNGTTAVGDGFFSGTLTRLAGRALLFSSTGRTTVNANTYAGWNSAHDALHEHGVRFASATSIGVVGPNGTTAVVSVVPLSTDRVDFALVLRGTGAFFCARIASGVWKLYWVGNTLTTDAGANLYFNTAAAANMTFDALKVTDLGGVWATDYGPATSYLAGARSAGDTFTHTADGLLDWTQTNRGSAGSTLVRFRKQDASNYWELEVNSSGDIKLNEVVAGVPTNRASTAAVVVNGARVMVTFDGATVAAYSSNINRWTYASATNFQTAAAGELNALATAGAVSDIVAWPRNVDAYIPAGA